MLLPAAMPQGRALWASALLLEAGTLGLFVSFLLGSRATGPFAVVAAAGLAAFLSRVVWMKRHPRPAPKELPRPDWGVLHALQALGYLALAIVLGLALAFAPPALWKVQAAVVYGAFGLVGFLAQMVVGVSRRLLPLYAWIRAYEGTGFAVQPRSPHATPARRLQAAVFFLWTLGVPLLATGLGLERTALISAGGAALFTAIVLGGIGDLVLFRRAAGVNPPGSSPAPGG